MKPQNPNQLTHRFNAKELRDLPEDSTAEIQAADISRSPLYLILDNVYDTYNIGGLFRLADALAVSKIYLCGISETPPNPRIKKASIGTYKVVPWEYCATTMEAIEKLRTEVPGVQIISIELAENSVPYTQYSYTAPYALVLGSETHGVSEDVLKASDAVVELPMHGYNISLNVIVSAAVVAYHSLTSITDNI